MAVHVTHGNPVDAVISIRGRGINGPKDLERKKVGSTAGSAARDVFDAFAKINGFDPSRIKTATVTGALRETMLVRGDVDAILGATISDIFTIKAPGIKMEDIIVMPCGKFGVELYGHAVITTAGFDQMVAVNLRPAFLLSRAVLPAMRAQQNGRIIFMARQLGRVADPGAALSGLTRAALISLARSMAFEPASEGIIVNAVSPGPIAPFLITA